MAHISNETRRKMRYIGRKDRNIAPMKAAPPVSLNGITPRSKKPVRPAKARRLAERKANREGLVL